MKLLEIKNQVSNFIKGIKTLLFIIKHTEIVNEQLIFDVPLEIIISGDRLKLESKKDININSNYENVDSSGNIYGVYINTDMNKEIIFELEKRVNDGNRLNELHCC